MKPHLIFCIIIFAVLTGDAASGESTAAFLRLGVGAKPASMGEAYAGVPGGILSLYSNPAGLTPLSDYMLSFSHNLWIAGMHHSSIIAGLPAFGGYAAIGINGLFVGAIDRYDRYGSPAAGSFSSTDISYTLAYSKEVADDASAGAALKYVTCEIDGYYAGTVAADIGFMGSVGPLNTGIAIQNIGRGMRFRIKREPLPLVIRSGASYSLFLGRMDLLISAEASHKANAPFRLSMGASLDDYGYYVIHDLIFSLRLGVKSYSRDTGKFALLSGGAGITHRNTTLDYAFVSLKGLGLTHRVSLGSVF